MFNKILMVSLLIFVIFSLGSVNAQEEASVCCEKTQSGLFCQNVPANECSPGTRQVPTSCESTSFCKPGTCYDSTEGTCADNTPQIVCNDEGGIWSEETPAQCELGCCTLGDQAAFVSLVRCKRLSGFLGLNTNYNRGINNEIACVLSVKNQDKGACVFDFEFERTCKFGTRVECESGSGNGTGIQGEFFKDTLCSAEELGTNCGPTRKTTCIDGRQEVYFEDTCGNPANIYDASKVEDQGYWSNVINSSSACSLNLGSSSSVQNCGNCNYLAGSFCRDSEDSKTQATYGDFICADLNCIDSEGKERNHGESWCVNSDKGSVGDGGNSVGSRFFRHLCVNGEEVVEPCADFRNEACIEAEIETSEGSFSQAACRVNRWQDCTSQIEQDDCENEDRRDCFWRPGSLAGVALLGNESGVGAGTCLPKDAPGLRFWEGEETLAVCALGDASCVITFEKKELLGGDWECIENCECLEPSWEGARANICSSLGDCGPAINWLGKEGHDNSFKIARRSQ